MTLDAGSTTESLHGISVSWVVAKRDHDESLIPEIRGDIASMKKKGRVLLAGCRKMSISTIFPYPVHIIPTNCSPSLIYVGN